MFDKMGLFDTIHLNIFCPFCGKEIKNGDFQTKDLEQRMNRYDLHGAIAEFIRQGGSWHLMVYSDCPFCKKWIELDISRADRKLSEEVEEILKESDKKINKLRTLEAQEG